MTRRALQECPRRGLSGPEAARYIGIGETKFYELVAARKMPAPLRIDRRAVWDIVALDRAFDALATAPADVALDDDWSDVTV